jgi:hypothetical protein
VEIAGRPGNSSLCHAAFDHASSWDTTIRLLLQRGGIGYAEKLIRDPNLAILATDGTFDVRRKTQYINWRGRGARGKAFIILGLPSGIGTCDMFTDQRYTDRRWRSSSLVRIRFVSASFLSYRNKGLQLRLFCLFPGWNSRLDIAKISYRGGV